MRFLLILAFGLSSVVVPAQSTSPGLTAGAASIHGHVADPTGALIPGAKITVTNALGVPIKSVNSNATGDYTVTGLAPGKYIVEAEMSGFALYTSPD